MLLFRYDLSDVLHPVSFDLGWFAPQFELGPQFALGLCCSTFLSLGRDWNDGIDFLRFFQHVVSGDSSSFVNVVCSLPLVGGCNGSTVMVLGCV